MSSTNASIPFDARAYLGNPTLTPAIAFAVVYSLYLIAFVAQLLRRVSRIYVTATIFCVLRVGAFSIRASIVKSGGSSGLLTADMILMSTGFVGILDVLYESLTQWIEYYVIPVHKNELITKAIRFKRLMHIVFLVAAVISVMGATAESSASTPGDLSSALDKVRIAAVIFLVTTAIMFIVSVLVSLSVAGASAMGREVSARPGWIVAGASVLSLVRITYAVVQVGKTQDELPWYCLSIGPEILVLTIFAWPGVADLYRKPESEFFKADGAELGGMYAPSHAPLPPNQW
ncbi:hypothetical protein BDK51DRAFT_27496 [Blyttiomyces helicus]|uniref:DUF7702 domain-containing protein n=1 Tax=Blyttiomyces helicus TaxID=388810 RepID=A0A4P9W4A1_9FUNG|nr:hypothetical protein BDK51DRAFT_27496 [Blyttiomyces helicus]|eukprot:RKO87014.1 hypothetical protein BDK51DRAFT_27496 [Blyttiomyces helicus]